MEPLGKSQMQEASPPTLYVTPCSTLGARERGSLMVMGQKLMPVWEEKTLELGWGRCL